jgi:hypothetical protein
LITALQATRRARAANRSVDIVSPAHEASGETVATSTVLELPPSESWSKKVSLESR